MKKPAVIFDRDNTLIYSDGYLSDPSGVKLINGAAAAIARARAMGFAIVTFSNQSGVARGMFSEEAVQSINRRMDQLLQEKNPSAVIDRHEYCPFHPEAQVEKYRQDSDLRKPRPGMILRAAKAMNLDLTESWVIGDTPRDIEAGDAAGCHTILVNDSSVTPSPAAEQQSKIEPDETVSNLAEALDVIEAARGASEQHRSPVPSPRDLDRLEHVAQQILDQLHRRHKHPMDFSASKLLAGVTQVLAIAAAAGSYFYRPAGEPTIPLLVAIFLQLLTISLLMMGRDSH